MLRTPPYGGLWKDLPIGHVWRNRVTLLLKIGSCHVLGCSGVSPFPTSTAFKWRNHTAYDDLSSFNAAADLIALRQITLR